MQEESIFIEALEKADPAERAAFLDGACAGDEALRGRIERLLARHGQPDSFLDARKAQLVELRFFAGLTSDQAAAVLGISPTSADRDWAFARAWLRDAVRGS